MVSNVEKASAIGRLKLGDSPQEISFDLGLPTKLVEEWEEGLNIDDLTAVQANTNAVSRLTYSTLPADVDNIAKLKNKIEQTAIAIIDQVSLSVYDADPIRAKTLQLLAATCTNLYVVLVNKDASNQLGNGGGLTLFQQLSRD